MCSRTVRALAAAALAAAVAFPAAGQSWSGVRDLAESTTQKAGQRNEDLQRKIDAETGAPPKTARPAKAAEAPPAAAGELTVEQIVQRTNFVAYYQGKDGRARVKMTVVDKQGQKREKELVILRRDDDELDAKDAATDAFRQADAAFTGGQRFYVLFEKPPDDAKTTFLVWKHLDKDDDRWLYLPNLDLVKRIAATDKRTSFVGSHFFYEDVSGRNVNDDTHELVKTTDHYYVLRNTPKDPKSVEFTHYDMYILKDTFVVAYIWYFDAAGNKYRTYAVEKWDKDKDHGYPTVQRARMEDAKIGGHTVLEYAEVKYNMGLPEELFSARFLKRTPYQFLK